MKILQIDGSQGEGGGQILRSALALSACLGVPCRLFNIRANRQRPGLQPQHLAAVRAATAITNAEVAGAERDSQTLDFTPGTVTAGHYQFAIGTAGSTTLVLQTVLPALLLHTQASSIIQLEGGTHNPLAPPFEFLQYAFLPLLRQMGASVSAKLEQPGFSPLGGGKITVTIEPLMQLKSLHILERGVITKCQAKVLLVNLPQHIAERELAVIGDRLSVKKNDLHYEINTDALGTGNSVAIILQSAHISECFTALGKKGLLAERVAELAVTAAETYLSTNAPIGRYLADQILLYIALAGGGRFATMQPSLHTLTNISVIKQFMDISFTAKQTGAAQWQISYQPAT